MKGLTATLEGPMEPFGLEELDVPEVAPGTILIENTGAAVCGSDLHGWRGDGAGRGTRRKRIPGHEFSGVVHSIGKGITTDSLRRPIK
ncbi:MAG: alcohol dehydrogenase catalytic domain-containing protein, partial [Chloroflexi bacterium]|nr:alcohol dehydrogenase catalytic domain-containing protein [Chloroflexota bacterium]